jgi:hypothetical protein
VFCRRINNQVKDVVILAVNPFTHVPWSWRRARPLGETQKPAAVESTSPTFIAKKDGAIDGNELLPWSTNDEVAFNNPI